MMIGIGRVASTTSGVASRGGSTATAKKFVSSLSPVGNNCLPSSTVLLSSMTSWGKTTPDGDDSNGKNNNNSDNCSLVSKRFYGTNPNKKRRRRFVQSRRFHPSWRKQEQQQQQQQEDRNPFDKIPTGVPTLDVAKAMPLSETEMTNVELVTLGAMGLRTARAEILRRHIMCVDKVPYDTACERFDVIAEKNQEGMIWHAIPYQVGIGLALTGAFSSIFLVFDLSTAEWFNEHFVTTDVPEPKDLETMFEVGSWTWNWMEPPLGQISFFLLCLQYSRAQMYNLGLKPYTRYIKRVRAERLAGAFPQYDKRILIEYSESTKLYKKLW